MKKKILLLTGLILAIGAAVYVSWPKEVLAAGPCTPACSTPCGCPTITFNLSGAPDPSCHEIEIVFPSPCTNEIINMQTLNSYPGPISLCSSGDCGSLCALGATFGGVFMDFNGPENSWSFPADECCGEGATLKYTFTPVLGNCCVAGELKLECLP